MAAKVLLAEKRTAYSAARCCRISCRYYGKFSDEILAPAAKQNAVTTTASVVRAAVAQLHSDSAKVLLFVNQTTTSRDRPVPAQTASSVMVSLTKTDDVWLISAFDPV